MRKRMMEQQQLRVGLLLLLLLCPNLVLGMNVGHKISPLNTHHNTGPPIMYAATLGIKLTRDAFP